MHMHHIYNKIFLAGIMSAVALFDPTALHSESIPTIDADKSYEFTRMPDQSYWYHSQKGKEYQLTPWVGQYVVILTKDSKLNKSVMVKILRAIDSAYVFYHELTGRAPSPYTQYDGRLVIAQVPDPRCSFIDSATESPPADACSYSGATGIELRDDVFYTLYREVNSRNPKFDQAVFYELGRNFWFYQDQLTFYEKDEIKEGSKPPSPKERSPFTTAFSILNKFLSMEAANVAGAPFTACTPSKCSELAFSEFRKEILVDLLDVYKRDTSKTWKNTILIEESPDGWGFGDFIASILNVINAEGGFGASQRFWQTMGSLPPAHNPEEAMTNFLRAGKAATGKDYRGLIRDKTLPPP